MITRLLGDLHFALRLLRRSPGFAATILFVLVAGISATTAMFSIVQSLILAPLPYDHPEELTALYGAPPLQGDHFSVSYRDFLDWRAQGTSFSEMAARRGGMQTLTSEGASPEDLPAVSVTADFFGLFRVHPLLGRLLEASDDQVGAPRVAVIAADLWHGRFASDPTAIGRSVALGGVAYTVVGVAPDGFRFSGVGSSRGADVWLPVAAGAGLEPHFESLMTDRDNCQFEVYGRRRPGVTIAAAQAQMSAIAAQIATDHPDTNTKFGVNVVELHDDITGDARSSVMILFAAIGLVFLVVCANVANLLLTRGAARRGEMAVRAGLGATRGRLVTQLLVETVVLFVIAAVVSLVLTRLALAHLVTLLPLDGAVASLEVRMDGRALAACLTVSLVSALIFGLVPALVVSQVEPEQVLKQTAARAGASRSHHLVRAGLVVAQIVLAFTLLAAGGLALRAFARFNARTPGFETQDRTTGFISLPPARYADGAAARRFVRDLLETVKREPGVESAAIDSDLPMAGGGVYTFMIEGRPPFPPGENPGLSPNTISTDYFRTMGVPLLRGRNLTDADGDGAPRVMLVNQTMADRFFPGEDPIGHRITFDDTSPEGERKWIEIVGIVGDVRRNGLSHPPVEEVFVPVEQSKDLHAFALVVRSPRADLQRTLPVLVQQVDPQLALSKLYPLSELVTRSLSMRRTMAVLLLGFAVTALLLAMLGIFGLVSYSTAQRTRELAIRMALGATPGTVIRMVMRGAVVLVAIGLALGLVGALALGRYLSTQMPGVASFDPLVYALVPALLLGTTLVACLAPALRALRIAPATALRYE